MSYIVRTHLLTKTFNGKEAVSNVSMKIEKGQIYGFLGPNGSGKTTVMKMLTNLIKPTSGEIELFGEKLTPSSYEVLKRMGSLIEYPIFYEKMTARENLELHCEYMGYHNLKAIDEALDLVRLSPSNDKPVKQFSLGMKQRLGLARAITTKPELLILDEPINGLDPVGIKEMRTLFQLLSKQYGMTLLISSHILGEIEHVADQIGVISAGKMVGEVTMGSLKEQHTDYIELVTPDIKKAAFLLENQLKLTNFKIVGDRMIRIYDSVPTQAEISKTLILNDVVLESINRKQGSVEDYFMSLIEEGKLHD